MLTKDYIPELQPLFCLRATLLEAQAKLEAYRDQDCQLRLRIASGPDFPLNIGRDDIEAIISNHIADVEAAINQILNDIDNFETNEAE